MQILHNELLTDITGVLLAGGRSSRMGEDKARLLLSGRPLFTRSLELLSGHFFHVLIAGDRPDLERPGIRSVPDIFPGSALGGLHTGLQAAQTDWIFVAPCDMPFPDSKILKILIDHRKSYDAVVPKTPYGYEPLFAAYHKNCLPHIESMLQNKRFRISDLFSKVQTSYLDWHALPVDWDRSLRNLNAPAQLQE